MKSDIISSALAMFVSQDRHRQRLRRPFFVDGVGYASDGRCAIRVKRAEGFDESQNSANFPITALKNYFENPGEVNEVSAKAHEIYAAAFMAIANCYQFATDEDPDEDEVDIDEGIVSSYELVRDRAFVNIDGMLVSAIYLKKAIDVIRICSDNCDLISVKMKKPEDKYSGTLLFLECGDVSIIIMSRVPAQLYGELIMTAHSEVTADGVWIHRVTEDLR